METLTVKKLLGVLALAGVALFPAGALAAFEARLTRPGVAGGFSGFSDVENVFFLELGISGLQAAGLDLGDAISLDAAIAVTSGSPFRIELYDDPDQPGDYSTESLGDFFQFLGAPSVTATPGPGPAAGMALSFTFSLFDPSDPTAVLTIPDSGVLARFLVRSAAGSPAGAWDVAAGVAASDEISPLALTGPATLGTSLAAPVPEPGTWAFMAGGLALLGLGARRRRVR
ncbi:MAG: PEP-CTERM sorting domain-containing protein [Betaproteobacteria bacterium]